MPTLKERIDAELKDAMRSKNELLTSVLRMLKPSTKVPAFSSVWLPDVMRLNDNVMPAGQTAGFLGKRWEPQRIIGDPSAPDYRVEGLALPPEISNTNPVLKLASFETIQDAIEATSSTVPSLPIGIFAVM